MLSKDTEAVGYSVFVEATASTFGVTFPSIQIPPQPGHAV